MPLSKRCGDDYSTSIQSTTCTTNRKEDKTNNNATIVATVETNRTRTKGTTQQQSKSPTQMSLSSSSSTISSSSSLSPEQNTNTILVHPRRRSRNKGRPYEHDGGTTSDNDFRTTSNGASSSQDEAYSETANHNNNPNRPVPPPITVVEQQSASYDSHNHRFRTIKDYIPTYLNSFVHPYHGDFCVSPMFHPTLVAQLMMEGFLPIAGPNYLLPKLHVQRCIINLTRNTTARTTSNNTSHTTTEASAASTTHDDNYSSNATVGSPMSRSELHISKSSKKKANKYRITINTAFDDVVTGCRTQHGSTCWLYPQLVAAFRTIYDATNSTNNNSNMNNGGSFSFYPTTLYPSKNNSQSPRISQQVRIVCPVRFYSVELWNKESGDLVAGELGYTVGSIYTSLTGFANESSAGSVQLSTLGCLLQYNGFTVWDLGMEMEYKKSLGTTLLERSKFVQYVLIIREQQYGYIQLTLPPIDIEEGTCKDIIQLVTQPSTMTNSSPSTKTATPKEPSSDRRSTQASHVVIKTKNCKPKKMNDGTTISDLTKSDDNNNTTKHKNCNNNTKKRKEDMITNLSLSDR